MRGRREEKRKLIKTLLRGDWGGRAAGTDWRVAPSLFTVLFSYEIEFAHFMWADIKPNDRSL